MHNNKNSFRGTLKVEKSGGYGGYTATATLSEAQLQAKCYQWLWNNHPATRRLCAHVPNGSSRNKAEASQLKAQGVLAGVHDLFFYWKGQLYWFELKVGSNRQSPEQIAFGEAMRAQGAVCIEIRTFEAFQLTIQSIL